MTFCRWGHRAFFPEGKGRETTDSSGAVSAFQGHLDRAMQDGRKNESAGKPLSNTNASGAAKTSNGTTERADTKSLPQKPIFPVKRIQRSSLRIIPACLSGKAKEAADDLEAAMEEGAGTQFLNRLKNFFLSLSNCDLDNISLDEDGLEALGDVLVQAGFDPAAVEEFISDLTVTWKSRTPPPLPCLNSWMICLTCLWPRMKMSPRRIFSWPHLTLPYIQSLLSMMGVDEQKISAIMDEVFRRHQRI